jgi:RimJ/RimL family protein N-acetyltransferase
MMHIFLETERLILRQFTSDDVENLVALNTDPAVLRFVGGVPLSRAEIEDDYLPAYLGYYTRFAGYGFWAVVEKSSGDFLGWFHFRPPEDNPGPDEVELGYRLHQAAWGRGYATEGARALIHKGFTEHGVQRVVAFALAENLASRRVMEKAGLALVRTYRHTWPEFFAGQEQELVEYALHKADWQAQSGATTALA